jgi:hypothetical protein
MKKAQIRLFESMAVLVVFLLLLGIGSVFYFKLQRASIEREVIKAENLHSLQLFQRALYLPELDCSFVSVKQDNCFDVSKLHFFSSLLEGEDYRIIYFDVFGFSKIRVRQVYPSYSGWFVLYSNVPGNYSSKLLSRSSVLLFNATSGSYGFGVVEVDYYAE